MPDALDTTRRYTSPLVTPADIVASVERALVRAGSPADHLELVLRALEAAYGIEQGVLVESRRHTIAVAFHRNQVIDLVEEHRLRRARIVNVQLVRRALEADRARIRVSTSNGSAARSTRLHAASDADLFSTVSTETQRSLFRIAERMRLVEATEFHVLRQRDGAVEVLPLPEEEPGEGSQVVVMAPISPNAPNARVCGDSGMDGYLAA